MILFGLILLLCVALHMMVTELIEAIRYKVKIHDENVRQKVIDEINENYIVLKRN